MKHSPASRFVAPLAVTPLSAEAIGIWEAGVRAVDPAERVAAAVRFDGVELTICGEIVARFDGADQPRILVVGGGKAGAAMARGFESAPGISLLENRYSGWLNVPADCVVPLRRIHLHAARPAGVNEPTLAGAAGTERILEEVAKLRPEDLCMVLISGGGSALLPAPAEGLTLEDKLAVTRFLSRAGASIHELNAVRQNLSRFKGGGLLRACPTNRMVVLVLSDVIGDPLSVIASGPTVPPQFTPQEALQVLEKFGAEPDVVPENIFTVLRKKANAVAQSNPVHEPIVTHHVIANNRTAVDASAREASRRGFQVTILGHDLGGEADQMGRELAKQCQDEQNSGEIDQRGLCLISGGEPVVKMSPSVRPQKGGRNQEFVLAALQSLEKTGLKGISILSGGTDGEDGPTDAAGAIVDENVLSRAANLGLDPSLFLRDHNSYAYFAAAEGLLKTGPTHTNVMDLRIAMIARA